MAKKAPYLKSRNAAVVTTYIIWCVSLYAIFFTGFSSFFVALHDKFHALDQRDGLVVIMMPILVLVFSGVVSSNIKAMLVFWRVNRPLPGHRAFTKLAPQDPRINMGELKRKIGEFPRSEKDQNSFWYKIYKKHQGADIVINPHRSFLLSRDLATIAFLFTIGGGIGLAGGGATAREIFLYISIMLVQYVILAVVARNHGNRFVCNVLVEHLTAA